MRASCSRRNHRATSRQTTAVSLHRQSSRRRLAYAHARSQTLAQFMPAVVCAFSVMLAVCHRHHNASWGFAVMLHLQKRSTVRHPTLTTVTSLVKCLGYYRWHMQHVYVELGTSRTRRSRVAARIRAPHVARSHMLYAIMFYPLHTMLQSASSGSVAIRFSGVVVVVTYYNGEFSRKHIGTRNTQCCQWFQVSAGRLHSVFVLQLLQRALVQ